MPWRHILKTAIAGTERSPLADNHLAGLGLRSSGDPARDALEALAAAVLARKAGFRMTVAAGSRQLAAGSGSRQDDGPVFGPEAAHDLGLMLTGRYADMLPEFLDLLARSRFRLPPEYLPDLLETAVRKPELAEKIMTTAGPAGAWLAAQNPHWASLAPREAADWFTASFAERKRLLADTRARNPLLALAWLEKTWQEEKPEHRMQFIDILHGRLSLTDEGLLERAFADKNRELRLAALQMLMRLPGSRVKKDAETLFEERFARALKPSEREKTLKSTLPDLSEDALQPWFSLLTQKAKADWRNELFRLFTALLPPSEWLEKSGLSREKVLASLDDEKDAAPLLAAIVLHADDAWAEPALQHFTRDFRHRVWQTKEMAAFLARYIPEAMRFLAKKGLPVGHENEFFLRALENFRRPWPAALLHDLLGQYGSAAFGGNVEIPGWHYASVLRVAAYHCNPQDAAGSEVVRACLHNPQRPREFEDFMSILRFREGMRAHLE